MEKAQILLITLCMVFVGCKATQTSKAPENVDTAIVGTNLKASEDIADQIEKKTDFILKNWDAAK